MKGSKYEEYADNYPSLNCRESLGLGNVGGDGVEYIQQNKKYSNQQCHPKIHHRLVRTLMTEDDR